MDTVVQVEGLRKVSGATVAVEEVSLEVREGEIFGFILAGIMPTARTAQIVAMVLLYPMLILSGAAWPCELMPATVQGVSVYVPLTYVVNLLRGLWSGAPWGKHLLDVGGLAGMLLLGIIVSAKTFRWE